jgi:hypothetical protein
LAVGKRPEATAVAAAELGLGNRARLNDLSRSMKRPPKRQTRPAAPRDASQVEQVVRDADQPALSAQEKAKLAAEAIRDEDA